MLKMPVNVSPPLSGGEKHPKVELHLYTPGTGARMLAFDPYATEGNWAAQFLKRRRGFAQVTKDGDPLPAIARVTRDGETPYAGGPVYLGPAKGVLWVKAGKLGPAYYYFEVTEDLELSKEDLADLDAAGVL